MNKIQFDSGKVHSNRININFTNLAIAYEPSCLIQRANTVLNSFIKYMLHVWHYRTQSQKDTSVIWDIETECWSIFMWRNCRWHSRAAFFQTRFLDLAHLSYRNFTSFWVRWQDVYLYRLLAVTVDKRRLTVEKKKQCTVTVLWRSYFKKTSSCESILFSGGINLNNTLRSSKPCFIRKHAEAQLMCASSIQW